VPETTCLGAAYAAGLAVGFWPDLETLRGHWREDGRWSPTMSAETRAGEYERWKKAVARTLDWEG
jgi:glycerol kinase